MEDTLLRQENERLVQENGYLLSLVAELRTQAAWASEIAALSGQSGAEVHSQLVWGDPEG